MVCKAMTVVTLLFSSFIPGHVCGETAMQSYPLEEWKGGVVHVVIEHVAGENDEDITQAQCTNESTYTVYGIEVTCSQLTYLNISCHMDDRCNGTTIVVTVNGLNSFFVFLLNSKLIHYHCMLL